MGHLLKKGMVAALLTAFFVTAMQSTSEARRLDANGNQIIGGRPDGCPHRYCGCGLRKYLGIDDVRLNLAWNWTKLFPRVSIPHAGVAAVRRHHVFLLQSHVAGNVWQVLDFNSGGGLSRIHERNVRGYVFVEPRQRMAWQ